MAIFIDLCHENTPIMDLNTYNVKSLHFVDQIMIKNIFLDSL